MFSDTVSFNRVFFTGLSHPAVQESRHLLLEDLDADQGLHLLEKAGNYGRHGFENAFLVGQGALCSRYVTRFLKLSGGGLELHDCVSGDYDKALAELRSARITEPGNVDIAKFMAKVQKEKSEYAASEKEQVSFFAKGLLGSSMDGFRPSSV